MKNPPPPDRYAEVKARYEGTQFRAEPTISNFYFWMNTRQPPFDDVGSAGRSTTRSTRSALERIYADTLQRTQQILPPGMPGYREVRPLPPRPARRPRN